MSKTIGGLLEENHQAGPWRGIRLLTPYTASLSLVVVILFGLTFVDMAAPYFLKLLIDDVFPQASGQGGKVVLLWLILPGMVVSYVARNVLFYAGRMRSLRISEDLCFDLRKRLYDHLQDMSLGFYRSHQPGRLSSRLMNDTFKIQAFIQDKLPLLIRYLLEFQILLIIIYVMNWRLAIASTIVLPLHLVTSRYFRNSIRQSHSEAQESLARAHGNIVEKFLGMEVVKGFSAEERESQEFQAAIDASRQSQIRSQRYHFSQKVVADLLVGVGTVVLLGYGTWNVMTKRMQSGEFLMFFLYVRMLYPAVLEIISGVGHLSKASASVDRVFEILAEPACENGANGKTAAAMAGHIEYKDVCFCYDNDTAVLKDINFTVEPGEHVAVVGPSGAGKTTLISLLPRFNDPTSGQVLIDGQSSDSIPVRALRGLFGIAFQEVFLFNASIYENLRYARPDASLEEVKEACKITGAHEFIERTPEGYYTKLGGAGSELSRGERQRITLARALVKDPKVLIIDEATASIDNAAAREIIGSIFQKMKDRTIIMVTHDIELLDMVKRMISIENGRVVYDGMPPSYRVSDSPAAAEETEDSASNIRIDETSAAAKSTRSDAAKRFKTGLGPLTGMLVLLVGLIGGCAQTTKTESTVEMDQPRVAGGVVLDEDDPNQLAKLAKALDELEMEPPESLPAVVSSEPPAAIDQVVVAESEAPAPPQINVAEALSMTAAATATLPEGSTRLISLPKLSDLEISEMCDRLELLLSTELGYRPAATVILDALPDPPAGISNNKVLMRSSEAGTRVLWFGTRQFVSQPAQCWVEALTVGPDGALLANDDLARVESAITEMIEAMKQARSNLAVGDLETKLIQLSYVNADAALALFRTMGITTLNNPGDVPETVDFAKLPYVVKIPDPEADDVGLIGKDASSAKSNFGLSLTLGLASEMSPNTIASPLTQLMVMFHPAHPEQFSRVRRALDTYIDRPARQIFIEGMVLEIGEEGLEDLGIRWDLDQGPMSINTDGTLNAGAGQDSLTIDVPDTSEFFHVFRGDGFDWDWSVKLRALIESGKAEVLSRPSVLTLNNRQSTIRVGQDLPIATSYEGISSGTNRLKFSFEYLPTGILLNVRPRINEDGSEVSMLIDTIVSARVPNADLTLRTSDGTVLASAPTISSRRVQTYGRIRNNTPFIIGGLVYREMTETQNKIPLLGDLPFIGGAFKGRTTANTKTEVIIVLTPYVLPEKQLVPRLMPKDEDMFDNFGNELFRDSYRIRTEDVFDLNFLLENPRIVAYRKLAREAVDKDFRLANIEPFRSFVQDSVPGESILVTRMIYEVVKRLNMADPVGPSRIIYMEGQEVGGYSVSFLESLLAKEAQSDEPFTDLGDKALAIIYHRNKDAKGDDPLGEEPIPEIRLIDCPDRDTWSRQLWELNQPTPDGQEQHTVLIQDASDLLRLRRALVLKRIINLNGGMDQMRLRSFSLGKVLLMPELKTDQIHVVDFDTAMIFFDTEHYYAATLAEIETQLTELDQMLRDPESLAAAEAASEANP